MLLGLRAVSDRSESVKGLHHEPVGPLKKEANTHLSGIRYNFNSSTLSWCCLRF